MLRYVQLSVTGNVLRVRFEPGVSLGNHGVRVTVRIPSIEGVDASGGSSVRLGRGVAAETFRSVLSGGAYLRGELLVETASLRGSGGAQMELTGRCGELDLSAGGGGRFLLEGLEAGRVEVDLSGGARARVWASEELTVGLSGGSGLGYRGSPRMEIRSVSGGSSIERI